MSICGRICLDSLRVVKRTLVSGNDDVIEAVVEPTHNVTPSRTHTHTQPSSRILTAGALAQTFEQFYNY